MKNTVAEMFANLKFSATAEAPVFIGTTEFGKLIVKCQLADDRLNNATPKFA